MHDNYNNNKTTYIHTCIRMYVCMYGICLLFIFVQVMISLAAQLHYSYAACDVTACVWLAKFMNECGESNESGEISACNYAIEEAAAEPATKERQRQQLRNAQQTKKKKNSPHSTKHLICNSSARKTKCTMELGGRETTESGQWALHATYCVWTVGTGDSRVSSKHSQNR